MNKKKICFKSDGTKETGAKIIKALEELGGINKSGYDGDIRNHYYFIIEDADNVITWELIIPQDYTLKDIHTWNDTPSKEELLEEAMQRYPIGTKIYSAFDLLSKKQYTVHGYYTNNSKSVHCKDEGGMNNGFIYYNNKWAEIVSLPENNTPSKDKPFYVVVTEENKEVLSKWSDVDLDIWNIVGLSFNNSGLLKKQWDKSERCNADFGNEITFEQFLELYPECKEDVKSKFKKGDCIVITECNYPSYNGNLNHCYKLISNNFHIGNLDRISLDEPKKKKARYATPEEIKEYDRLGKPYDVTTLLETSPENVVPEYVECISTLNHDFKVGNIYTFPNPIDEEGLHRQINRLDGAVWQFKPSTKEAYESFKKSDNSTVIEEFVLPEKWCIRGVVTSHSKNKDLKSYFHKISKQFDITSDYCFYYILDNSVHRTELLPNGYTEITFEQFKKYVLEEKDEFVYAPTDTFKQALDYTKLSKEEILEIAKKKYKDALEVIPLNLSGESIESDYHVDRPTKILDDGIECSVGFVYVWNKPGVWAEITKYKEDAFATIPEKTPVFDGYHDGTSLPKYKASLGYSIYEEMKQRSWSELIKEDLEIRAKEKSWLDRQRYSGFAISPELMHYPLTDNECFQKEVSLYKKSKSKLFSTFVGEVKEVKIPLTKVKTSKLITNK